MNLQVLKIKFTEREKMGMVYKWAGLFDFVSIILILLGNLWIPAIYLILKGILFLIFISRRCVISMMDLVMGVFIIFSGFSQSLVVPALLYLFMKVFLRLYEFIQLISLKMGTNNFLFHIILSRSSFIAEPLYPSSPFG